MRSLLNWQEVFPDVDGEKQVVWDIAFKADGSLLVAAVGKRLVVFNVADGMIVKKRVGAWAASPLPPPFPSPPIRPSLTSPPTPPPPPSFPPRSAW